MGIEGRSHMNKRQLQRAVDSTKRRARASSARERAGNVPPRSARATSSARVARGIGLAQL